MPDILINGAGIAGETLAVLLARAGWSVTVVEVAPALRTGGQTVDLRGDSREVLQRLGLLEAALQVLVPQSGIAWVDQRGRRLAQMPVEAFGGQGFVSHEELLRTDLAALLHRAAVAAGAVHRFGDTVEDLVDHSGGVRVRLRSGEEATFDVVVGADGAHSRVRVLRFGPEERFRRRLGLAHAWFTLAEGPCTPALDGWNVVHQAPGRRAVAVRPGRPGHQEVGLTFAAQDLPARSDAEGRLSLLDDVFADVGWRAPELIAAARCAPDLALDVLDQVHMNTWVDGRVLLLGDAAWCSSPLSGLGTALGLRGAAELADVLGDGAVLGSENSFTNAAARFERVMRPRVRAAQKLIPGRVSMVAPRTWVGIHLTALLMRVLQWPALAPLTRRIAAGSGHAATSDESLLRL